MEEYWFKEDKFGNCLEKCNIKNDGTMIGSVKCQECEFSLGHDKPCKFTGEINWVKCSKITEATNQTIN